uniref:Uncharacterized protein n=1 Tax=Romanomermis culicivorax TaxID=13658 RepID=A0A915LDH0_ROMCU
MPYNTHSHIWEYFEREDDDMLFARPAEKIVICILDAKKTKQEQATDEAKSQLLIQSCFVSKAPPLAYLL